MRQHCQGELGVMYQCVFMFESLKIARTAIVVIKT